MNFLLIWLSKRSLDLARTADEDLLNGGGGSFFFSSSRHLEHKGWKGDGKDYGDKAYPESFHSL